MVTTGNRFLGDHGATFVAKVAVKVQQLFLGLAVRLADFYDETGVSNPHPSSPLPALLLARMCHHLQSWGIPHVHTLLLDLAAMSPLPAELSVSTTKLWPMIFTLVSQISLPDIVEKLFQAASKLQAFYVKRQGQLLSGMVHLGINSTQWLRLKEPRDVRQVRPKLRSHCPPNRSPLLNDRVSK